MPSAGPHAGVEVQAARRRRAAGADAGDAARRGRRRDLAERLTADGWFRTGDLGRVDDDGFVWIEGRVSDMINRGGLKVFPAQVEEVLAIAPGVRDAAVVGVPDDRFGEVPGRSSCRAATASTRLPSKPGAGSD